MLDIFEVGKEKLFSMEKGFEVIYQEVLTFSSRNLVQRETLSEFIFKGKRLEDQALMRPLSKFELKLDFFKKINFKEFEEALRIFSGNNLKVENLGDKKIFIKQVTEESIEDKRERLRLNFIKPLLELKKVREKILSEIKKGLSPKAYKEFHLIADDIAKRINLKVKKTIDGK